jgi:muramidase (phage lysozyme)
VASEVLTAAGRYAMLDAMWRRAVAEIPADLRARLETARLDLLALFRALDRMNLTPEQMP